MTALIEILCDVWDHCMTADEAREKIDALFWNKLSNEASVEAAIEATKEKAAHIVVGWTTCGPITETDRVLEKIIAAIRSMK